HRGRRWRSTGRTWGEMSEQERRDFPNDFEAQAGQGAIPLHSEERLATSDRGVVMQRRLLQSQIEIVAKGGDRMGVTFDPANATVHVDAENRFKTVLAAEQDNHEGFRLDRARGKDLERRAPSGPRCSASREPRKSLPSTSVRSSSRFKYCR